MEKEEAEKNTVTLPHKGVITNVLYINTLSKHGAVLQYVPVYTWYWPCGVLSIAYVLGNLITSGQLLVQVWLQIALRMA